MLFSHGLSVKCEHDENPIYQSLLSMLVDEGYEGDDAARDCISTC